MPDVFAPDPVFLSVYSLCVVVPAVIIAGAGALFFFRRVRLERPPVGTFNGRDIAILFVMVNLIPLFYLQLPRNLLIGFIALTICAAVSIGFRPVLNPWVMW